MVPTPDPNVPVESPAKAGLLHVEALLSATGRSAHYRVLSQVGEGGGGVVYKGIDTRLNRAVAIKTIHFARLNDAHATARVRTEALAAASLDHPYICKIYELIEAVDENLIVMEFVEGETLSDFLSKGTPPLAKTLQFAIEIAEGLNNAHEHGLVHRDLKPTNIMVTHHGHIKLLDFGLALADAAGKPNDETRTLPSPTDALAGTPHYMAPEQAAGKSITARADLFSLGAVLFRCVTGSLPFKGGSPYDYVGHLLSDEPIPVYKLAPQLPGELARLIDQCLEKVPANRPESAGAVVRELRRLAEAFGSGGGGLTTIPPARTKSRLRLVAIAAVLAVIAASAWRWFFRVETSDTLWRLQPFVTTPSDESDSRISPDRQWISYLSTLGGETQLLVKRVSGGEAQRVIVPAGTVLSQLWSPGGDQLAYVLRQGESVSLQVVPAFFGGAPLQSISISPAPDEVRLVRWIERTIYLQSQRRQRRKSLLRVNLDGSSATLVDGPWASVGVPSDFDVSPDGARLVVALSEGGQSDLWTSKLDGSSMKRLTNDASFERYPLWSGSGTTIIYQSNRGGQIDLWELSTDSGRSRLLTSSRAEEQPESTSADGTLISFRQLSEEEHLWMWNPSGGARPLTNDTLNDAAPSAMQNGSKIAFQRSHPSAAWGNPVLDASVFVAAIEGSKFALEPQSISDGFAAELSPDGTRLAYLLRSPNPFRATLLVRDLTTGAAIELSTACAPPAFSPYPFELVERDLAWNGASTELYFVERPEALHRYQVGASSAGGALATAGAGEVIHDLQTSADGRYLAYLVSSTVSILHVMDVLTGKDRTITRFPTRVGVRGWLADGSVVLVRASALREDAATDMEVLASTPAGILREIGFVDRAFMSTARLDPAGSILYVTRSEDNVHNLYALSLTTHGLRRVTDNTLPGVTFSGVRPLDRGRVVGIRQERKSDIWLMDTGSSSTAPPSRAQR
jgi:serine/threonine protein kinase/Tol biopolymer transport system component